MKWGVLSPLTPQIVLSGNGKNFCAGIDLSYLQDMFNRLGKTSCPGRMREQFRRHIMTMQVSDTCSIKFHTNLVLQGGLSPSLMYCHLEDCFTSLERCRLPVIAAIHGCCVGGGVDLISACDIRICSEDATFCVKVGQVMDAGYVILKCLLGNVCCDISVSITLSGRSFPSSVR